MEASEPRKDRTEKIKKQIRHLKDLLENYSDEIPEHVISGSGNYKVRRNWWHGFFNSMDYAMEEFGISDPSIKNETDTLYTHFREKLRTWLEAISAGEHTNDLHRTTKDEIDKANDLLKRQIEKLQNTM